MARNKTPGVVGADNPQTVEEARRAVEQTRERLTDTVEELEDRLVYTTDRLNVVGQVADRIRSNPWPAIAAAFSIGVFIAVVRSRDDDDDDDDDDDEEEDDDRPPRVERLKRVFRRRPPTRRERIKKILRRR